MLTDFFDLRCVRLLFFDGDLMGTTSLQHSQDRQRQEGCSEARFRLLVENATDLVAILDRAGRYQYVSPSSLKIVGYAPQEMLGRTIYNGVHPEDIQLLTDLLSEMASQEGITVRTYFRLVHQDGRWLDLDGVILP